MADEDEAVEGGEGGAPEGAPTELPPVRLGDGAGDAGPPVVRLVPGRVPVSSATYPIYTLLVLTGGIAANVALDTDEWSFGVVALAWFITFMWTWMYAIAWYYRRFLMKWWTGGVALAMYAFLGWVCLDRGQGQWVGQGREVVFREPIPSLAWAAGGLAVCGALLVLHMVYLGQGYRERGG
jgi:hypothetical protein